jgi:hypothetical protein
MAAEHTAAFKTPGGRRSGPSRGGAALGRGLSARAHLSFRFPQERLAQNVGVVHSRLAAFGPFLNTGSTQTIKGPIRTAADALMGRGFKPVSNTPGSSCIIVLLFHGIAYCPTMASLASCQVRLLADRLDENEDTGHRTRPWPEGAGLQPRLAAPQFMRTVYSRQSKWHGTVAAE